MKNSLISRFVMLFLFVFGCGTMSPIPALAGGDSYEVDFYCADGSLATLPNGNGAIIFLEDGFDCSEITVPQNCDSQGVTAWSTQYDNNIGRDVICDYVQYRIEQGDTFVKFTPYSYGVAEVVTANFCMPFTHYDDAAQLRAAISDCAADPNKCDGCAYTLTVATADCPSGSDGTNVANGMYENTNYYANGMGIFDTGAFGSCEFWYELATKSSNAVLVSLSNETYLGFDITLNGNGATSAGTSKLYTRFTTGVYTDSALSKSMTTSANAITKPSRTGYTVTYNTNSGYLASGTTATVNYTFNGYYSASSGGTQYINANGYITSTGLTQAKAVQSNATWYAQWSSSAVSLPTPVRNGYTFDGWYTNSNLTGTKYSAGASYTPTSNATLYAKWNPNTYTITLDQDGGKGGQSSVMVVSGQVPPTLTSLPTKDGYTFGGYGIYSEGKGEWQSVYYNADGTGNGEYSSASDITLYAIWEPKVYDVTLYANGCTGYPKTIQMTHGQTMSILPSTIDDCDSCGALQYWYVDMGEGRDPMNIMSSDTYRNDVHGTEFYAQFVSVKTPCSAGYYLPKGLAGLGSEVCVECPAGSYCGGGELECSNGGDVGIASCPNGYTSDKGVADSIEDCYISIPAGKYLDTAKSATLKDCPAGYYCPAQSKVYYGKISDKKSCSAGTYSDTTNAASCTSCPAGYYCPDNNMTSPTVCSGNTYSNAKGAKTCTSCPTGYSISGTEYTNHDAKSDCTISCGAGTYVKTADGACVNAGVGYYMAAHTVAAGTTETPNQCPNGGTTSGETTSAIASCYKVLSGCTVSGVTGTGKKTCYYTSGSGINAVYNNRCTVCAIDNCPTGYELVNGTCNGKTYTITLNDNGGSGGLGTVKEVYNTRWTNSASETITTVTVPVRSGYSFNGYYTSATGGTRRIDATGALPSNTTFTANTPLYAQWTPKSYTIKYVSTTSGKLGEQDCTYGETCIVGQAVAGAVTQTGATFNGIWTNDEVPCGTGSMEQGKDMNVDYLTCSAAFADANNDELPVLKADFTPNTYYVKYDANGGTGTIGNTTCTYGTVCRLTESGFTKDGYTLLGWSLSKTATTATYTDKATNLTETNGATITLYAVWGSCTPCTTSVGAYCYLDTSNGICEYNSGCNTGYSKQSGSTDAKPLCSPNLMKLPVYKTILDANNNAIPVTYINVYYNSKVPETFDTSVFSRSGYSIAGISGIGDYCTGVYYDGDGNRYSDRTVMDTGCKFYADWTANTYAVTLDSPDAYDHGTAVVYYKYEQDEDCIYYADINAEQCLSENKGTKIKAPARVGYSFRGYYTGNSGTGTEYVDDTGTISETLYSTVADDSTLQADWEANEYTLTFNANSGIGTAPTITTCTYESCVLPENTYTKLGHVFSGWYFDPNDDGEIEAQPGENIGQYLANSVAGQTIEITAGWVPCSAGNYCPGDNTSIPCAVGSYSAAGASSCTACQNGTTTTAAGQTYCDTTCTNAANAATWIDAKWLTNNELSYRCAIDTCKTGYYRDGTGDSTFGTSYTCDPNTYTITYSCGDGATGTPPAKQTVTYNQSYTSAKTIGTCVKPGYVVEGWNTTVTGGTTVPIASYPGSSGTWTFTENKTFTARWKPKCYEVEFDYLREQGDDFYEYLYTKHGDGSKIYTDEECTNEIAGQQSIGGLYNSSFIGYFYWPEEGDAIQCTDNYGIINGNCIMTEDSSWYARYRCDAGYTASGDIIEAGDGDICSNCYQVKLSPADGNYNTDFLYTDGTESYEDAMCQNPYQGIVAPAKENATWVGYTNRSWDKNYTGEYPTDALCTSDESQGANTGKCPVADNNQTWTAVYKCNDGYMANGTYVDYNTECSQNVYSVDLVYYCSDPTGAGDESTPPEKPSVCYSNRTCIMPENSCSYEGYQFTGWRVNCDTCGDNSKIYVQPGDDISWQINAIENGSIWDVDAMWELNTYTVTLDANGGIGGTTSVTATYGSAMPSITVPTRSGYTFNGYFTATSGGTQYYTSSGVSARNWDKTSSTTLYAQWTLTDCAVGTYPIDASGNYPANGIPEGFVPHECLECPHAAGFCPGGLSAPAYAVTFMEDVQESILLANINNEYYIDLVEDNNGNLTARRIYTLPDAAIPARTGYVFDGYWTQSTGGEQYIDKSGNFLKGTSTDIELYAHWNASVSTVTLDANGGTGGATSVTATYDSAMPSITVPTRSGYTFNGYYTTASAGTQYYTSSGVSARDWDKTSSTTLYAQWTLCPSGAYCSGAADNNSPTLCPTDIANRSVTSAEGSDNATDCYVTCPASITISNGKTAVINSTLNYNGTTYPACAYTATCNDGYSVQNNDTANPSCTANTYTVAYNANGGTGTTASSSHTYDVSKALTANGFTNGTKKFLGWNTSKTATSATYTNEQSVKNLTATNKGTVTLYAIWSDCQACSAGTGASCSMSVTNNTCTYTTACKTGYNTLTNSGKYNPSCSANTYTVAYDNNDGTGTMNNQSRTYNDGAKLTANILTRTGYTFVGWNTNADGTGTSYGDQATGNLTSTNGATVTLYAQWGQCQACSAGTGASCSMSVTNNTCTYTTACKTGYNTLTNSGKYNPSCTANTYTVTYSCGDGDGTVPKSTTATYDSVFTMAQNTCSKTGYDFVEWKSSDVVYKAGQKFNWTYLENKTFVAQWNAKRITCQSGEFLDRTTCMPCSVGFKCPAASVTYTYNADIQGRTACSGTSQYQNQTGQTVCKTVDDGYYKISDTAQAVCGNNYYCKNSVRIQCPDGGITNTETASLGSQCYKSGLSCTTDGGFGTNTCNYELTTNDYTDCTECGINKCADGYYMDANACEICPVGSFCANNVKTLCPLNYTTTDVGAVLKTQCVTTCSDKDVVYGTAYKDTATVLWPAVCTYTYGISVTGNPCKIIDNVCVETSCKYDYEMIDGKCELCVRDNALGFKQGNGNCIVETCLYGYRPFGQSCISDTIECSADGAVAAEQKWNPNTNSFGPCTIIECATGYHIEENSCVLDTQACTIENGTGEKVYDHDLGKWGECVVSSCLPGYTNNPKLTHETWKPCGRCNNMFGANGERIVSSYLTECEIASCMYQGEKYILENNECISICDERSDETGSRYWDGNKCVHDCKPGFLKW